MPQAVLTHSSAECVYYREFPGPMDKPLLLTAESMGKRRINMAKKKNPLACPSCATRLFEVMGHCSGIILTCPNCESSILADVDEKGRIRLTCEPVEEKSQTPVRANA